MRQAFYLTILLAALFSNACSTPTSGDNSAAPASPAANDQAAAPRQRYWVTETHVKPEMATQFREFYLKETLPAQQKGGVKQQSVWTTANIGEAFTYITIRPLESMQEFDEPNPMTKALGEEGARKWATKRATMIVSTRSYITQARPEMTLAPSPDYVPKLLFVVRQSIAAGRSTDYENYIKNDVLPIIKKTNPKGFVFRKVTNGGDTEMYISATLMDSFAEQEKWAAELLKEGYGNVVGKRAGLVMHRENAVYRYVPELSIRPQAVAANK